MEKIVIAGGTGFIGNYLAEELSRSFKIVVLSRNHHEDTSAISYVQWDINKPIPSTVLEGTKALINCVGRSVNCRYTLKNKNEIYNSRLISVRSIADSLKDCENPPEVWINTVSATIYKHSYSPMTEEKGEFGTGFSVDVCKKWEKAILENSPKEIRTVLLRSAIVIGPDGGALQPLLNLAKIGAGGKQGPGNQMFSWIHQRDLLRIVRFLLNRGEGIYNASSPGIVTNKEFMRTLRHSLGTPLGIPMPKLILGLGAHIINTETELILKSRCVYPERLLQSGFTFQFPSAAEALEDIVDQKMSSTKKTARLAWG